MGKIFGLFKSYDDAYLDLYEYLTEKWKMKPDYAKPFLDAYKRIIGKTFCQGREKIKKLEKSSDPEIRLMMYSNVGQEYDFALVGQAYQAYMGDLRRGRHVGTPVEKVIWAILANRSDLVEALDPAFAKWIDEKQEEKFPALFKEVFQFEE